ncbi:MAG: alanine--tRNA ligase [Candidatus Thermoplasmatota archaeon]|nr:alanine--tRNA ligase [Candidatus Thermoplasmatota archaeon]MCL5790654.1 alanine--tRNA ligase [Candidatus Thermoplasmatota archaeon]
MTADDDMIPEFDVEFFRNNSFFRKKCIKCGMMFWTQDRERMTCGDPPCDEYGFIGNPAGKGPMSIDQVREAFFEYFSRDHGLVRPYPVVPRWREDVLLVNASIYDFQPHVTSGMVRPPANPLVMSQPSIRMNDLDSVGISGRHLTSFEMLCHDAFNTPQNLVYWVDGTVSRCHGLLTEAIGINGNEISYKEKPWSGGGNAGNALEVFVRGLEVATLVFMDLKEDPSGEIDVDGLLYRKMDQRIVDTGYGLERISWVTTGAPTVYDSIYRNAIDTILLKSGMKVDGRKYMGEITRVHSSEPDRPSREIESDIENKLANYGRIDWKYVDRIRQAYILGDHCRSLIHMFRDYVIPSNVKVGYLMRLLLRRSFRAIDYLGFNGSLMDIMKIQEENLKGIVDGFPHEFAESIIAEEWEKYRKSESRGKEEIERILKKKGKIDVEDLELLYDSYGIVPDMVSQQVEEKGMSIEIPNDFHNRIVSKHSSHKENVKSTMIDEFRNLETRTLYYDDPRMMEFTAIVLGSRGNLIVTNQTAFYPTGGGQPHDLGFFKIGNRHIDVIDVIRQEKAIIHVLTEEIPRGTRVRGFVDYDRRRQLMIHHTSTHLLLGITRSFIGDQVWQAGAQKGVESSRIDITCNIKITRDMADEIERRCLKAITDNRKVTVRNLEWNMAIGKYGFRLFEGGVPLSDHLRVVDIDGIDVEGCGGTHLSSTGEIGFLKIISVENIQEGIQRITFCSGPAALKYVQKIEGDFNSIRDYVRATSDVPLRVKENMDELLKLREKSREMVRRSAESIYGQSELIDLEGVNLRLLECDDEESKVLIPILMKNGESGIILSGKSVTVVGKTEKEASLIYMHLYNSAPGKAGKVITDTMTKGITEKLIN